jgi:ADP-ribose pyrophosphatase
MSFPDPSEPRETLAQGKYLRLMRQGSWEYCERPGVSGIVGLIPVTDARELVLVEQYRVPLGKRAIELPAGLAGDIAGQEHEALELAAARELEEETGYRAGKLRFLVRGPNSAGSSSHLMDFYLATQLVKVGAGGGDEHEDITVHVVKIDGLWDWLKGQELQGKLIDPKIFAGLWFIENVKD